LSIDGRPPASRWDGERAPVLVFSAYEFGGTAGCNDFGGLGLLADGRYTIHSWSSDARSCPGELNEQEEGLRKLFSGRPNVRMASATRLRLDGGDHAVELERAGPNNKQPLAGPKALAGTDWRIETIDGVVDTVDPAARVLGFTATNWSGSAACATLYGTWRSQSDRIVVGPEVATTEQNCPPDLARTDDALFELMRSNPRYLIGPNGELLIAGGGHALAGERAR